MLLLAARPASADTPAPPPPPPSPSEPPASFDFNLLPSSPARAAVTPALDPRQHARFEAQVQRRRRLLLAHQVLGILTFTALAATAVVGQLNFEDRFDGGGDTGRFRGVHLGLALATTVLFAATGVTALAAPNPYPKPVRFDAALVHKSAMAAAAACMVALLVLGPIAAAREGHVDQKDIATAHLVVGWAALGFMGIGATALLFP